MRIEKIYYQRNFPIGQFLFETIGIGIIVNEGEDPQQALDEAKKLACEYNTANNPHLAETQPSEPTTLPTLKVEREQIEGKSVAEQIATVTELKVLEGYKLLVKNNPDWLNAYNLKLKELTA
jgi:hypothetical protein